MTMKLRLSIPELRITGQYKTSGRIFVLAVEGAGTFWNILSTLILLIDVSVHSLQIFFVELVSTKSI